MGGGLYVVPPLTDLEIVVDPGILDARNKFWLAETFQAKSRYFVANQVNSGARQRGSSLPVCARKNPKFPHPPLDLQQHRRRRRRRHREKRRKKIFWWPNFVHFQTFVLNSFLRNASFN